MNIKQHYCIVTQEESNEARELLVKAREQIWENESGFEVLTDYNILLFDDEINKWIVGVCVAENSKNVTYPQFKEMLNAKIKEDENAI